MSSSLLFKYHLPTFENPKISHRVWNSSLSLKKKSPNLTDLGPSLHHVLLDTPSGQNPLRVRERERPNGRFGSELHASGGNQRRELSRRNPDLRIRERMRLACRPHCPHRWPRRAHKPESLPARLKVNTGTNVTSSPGDAGYLPGEGPPSEVGDLYKPQPQPWQ